MARQGFASSAAIPAHSILLLLLRPPEAWLIIRSTVISSSRGPATDRTIGRKRWRICRTYDSRVGSVLLRHVYWQSSAVALLRHTLVPTISRGVCQIK